MFSLDIVISLFEKNNLHYDSLFLAECSLKTYQPINPSLNHLGDLSLVYVIDKIGET